MAKEREKRIAFDYYTKQGLTAKAISDIIGVTEKTISGWVTKGNWKSLRDAHINSEEHQISNIKALISELTEQHIGILEQIKEAQHNNDKPLVELLRKQSSYLSQEVAIQTKALERVSGNKLTLAVYLKVMNDIFQNLQEYDKTLYASTLDFQETHLQNISLKLG